MHAERLLSFGPYRLDPGGRQLWKGTQAVKLTPKALAVLCYLVDRAGQVVIKEELFQSVWADTVVSDAALTVCVQELRRVLRDDAHKSHYIETVHRRGFRFIAPLTTAPLQGPGVGAQGSVRELGNEVARRPEHAVSTPTPGPRTPSPVLVGRTAELTQLHGWLDKAIQGERQLVFVTGEPGIGKTALVEAFRQRLETGDWRLAPSSQISSPKPQASIFIGHGQCIELYGTGEPYLPLLAALGRLCREPDGQRMRTILAQYAPTWMVQMPSLLTTDEVTALQGKTAGATRVRMLRELAEAIEAVTAERPLVLWLEDLHWSDVSTLDWLAFIARRREAARLLVLGTYRPVEVLAHEHPLKTVKQELHLHGQCQELIVDFLREEHVAEYLVRRFAVGAHDRAPFSRLARVIHQRTDGNPLFMVNVVDQLMSQGVFVQEGGQWTVQKEEDTAGAVPESLRQMIEQQVERLSAEERQVVEAASVAGVEFSAAAVAAGVGTASNVVEEQCTGLARREQFLHLAGSNEWPDGTVAARYGFRHALYQEVLYERLPAGRRQRLHQQIGERKEAAYGERAREIAAELALHFEEGRDYRRAIPYLQLAGDNAAQRSASMEATSHFTKGLALLQTLPDTPERAQSELMLQLALGTTTQATKGHGAPEVSEIYARARVLCLQVGETSRLFQVLFNQWQNYNVQGEYTTAGDLGRQLLQLAEQADDAELFLEAHHALWTTSFCLGEFVPARDHHKRGWAIYDPQQHHAHAFVYGGHDPGACSRSQEALVLWALGYPAQALQQTQAALALAHELAHPMSLGIALNWAAIVYQFRREARKVREYAEAAMALCSAQGFSYYLAWGMIMQGWALAEQGHHEEGIAQMRQSLAAHLATGAKLLRPYYLGLLAEAQARAGEIQHGFSLVAEALAVVEQNGTSVYEAELYRLRGELTLAQFSTQRLGSSVTNPQFLTLNTQAKAEGCFLKAIDVARRQQAKSWELRASTSLARLWQQQGKTAEAHRMLSEIYNWFTEGFDTKDLQEAKGLLEELGQ